MTRSITHTKRSPTRHSFLIGEAMNAVRSVIQTKKFDLAALNIPDIVCAIVVMVVNIFRLASIRQTPNISTSTTRTHYPHN